MHRSLDPTAALSRAYSDTLAAERPDTLECAQRAADIQAHMRRVWMAGSSERIEAFNGSSSLARLVSEALVDLPGNPLHDFIEIVRERAACGDRRALRLIDSMAAKHAAETVELSK